MQILPTTKTAVATNVMSGASAKPAAPAPATSQQPRAVAKKSTAKRQYNTDNATTAVTPYQPPVEMKPSHSIVVSNYY